MMTQNRLIYVVFFLFISINAIANKDVDKTFNKILNDIDSIIKKSENKNQIIESHYNLIIGKIHSNEIMVTYDTTLNYGFLGGTSASIIGSTKYSLAFGKFIIDAYDSFPHLVQGMIIHEIQHLYDFITNRELIEISKKNPIEQTYFEIDALSFESLFLKTYIGKKPNLSPIEEYLIMDFDNNGVGSATLFQKVDLELLHKLDAIREKKISFEKGMEEFINIGTELCNSIKFNDDKWNNYCNVVTLSTFTSYSKQILHDLLFVLANKSYSSSELELKQYPKYNEIVTRVQKIIKENSTCFEFYNKTMDSMDNYIIKKIKK